MSARFSRAPKRFGSDPRNGCRAEPRKGVLSMSEARDEQFVQRFRKNLERSLANCNRLLAEATDADQRRHGVAAGAAPDELAEAYTIPQRVIKALATLDGV